VDGVLSSSGGVSSGSLLALLFQKAWRFLSRKSFSSVVEEHGVFYQRLNATASVVGPGLLEATSLDDLDSRIDAALERPDVAISLNAVAEATGQLNASTTKPSWPAPGELDFVDVLGEGQRPLLREAERLLGALHDAYDSIQILAEQLALVGVTVSLPERPFNEDDPVGFLSDPEIPPAVSSALLGGVVATLSLFAIYHAQETGRRLEPWLAHAIAERFATGLRKHVALLASLPFVTIDPEVVPLAERLDLATIEREHREANLAVERFLRDADGAGQDVYVPEPRE
jgi:hypothetical protein